MGQSWSRRTVATTASAQLSTEWPVSTRCRSSRPALSLLLVSLAANARRTRARSSAVVAPEVELDGETAEKLVEVRIAREDRYCARRRLVHDLVERAARGLAPRRVDDGVEAPRRAPGRPGAAPHPRAPPCRRALPTPSAPRARPGAAAPRQSRTRRGSRPADRPPQRGRARTPGRALAKAFDGEVRPSASSRSVPLPGGAAVASPELRHVDAVADPEHLRIGRSGRSGDRR